MKNLQSMMKQAQKMQEKMQEMQAAMEDMEVEGVSGAGLIRVTMTGKGNAKDIHIDPSLMNPEDISVLQDLLVAAMNDARVKIDQKVQEKTQEMMGGMQLPPGMNLPF